MQNKRKLQALNLSSLSDYRKCNQAKHQLAVLTQRFTQVHTLDFSDRQGNHKRQSNKHKKFSTLFFKNDEAPEMSCKTWWRSYKSCYSDLLFHSKLHEQLKTFIDIVLRFFQNLIFPIVSCIIKQRIQLPPELRWPNLQLFKVTMTIVMR